MRDRVPRRDLLGTGLYHRLDQIDVANLVSCASGRIKGAKQIQAGVVSSKAIGEESKVPLLTAIKGLKIICPWKRVAGSRSQ
jgi:hypothetical protein